MTDLSLCFSPFFAFLLPPAFPFLSFLLFSFLFFLFLFSSNSKPIKLDLIPSSLLFPSSLSYMLSLSLSYLSFSYLLKSSSFLPLTYSFNSPFQRQPRIIIIISCILSVGSILFNFFFSIVSTIFSLVCIRDFSSE